MYQIDTEGKKFSVAFDTTKEGTTGKINGKDFAIDVVETGDGVFNIIRENKSYRAQVFSMDPASKSIEIKVEGHKFKLQVKDRYDLLLEEMGLNDLNAIKAKDLTAPMTGMVLEVMVKQGDKVIKGNTLIILEAMKMENVLKAAVDGIVDQCHVKAGDSTEKNEILISFKS